MAFLLAVLTAGMSALTSGSDADDATRRALTEMTMHKARSGRSRTRSRASGTGGHTLLSGRYDVVAIRTSGDVAVMSGNGHPTWREIDYTPTA